MKTATRFLGAAVVTALLFSARALAIEPPTTKLLNISTRMGVGTGDNVLIGGFIVTGTVPKSLIVRAIGPSLGNYGVTGFLADPTLELHEPDGTVITNDNWKDTDQAEIEASGLQPSEDLESAIIGTLAPGLYTAIVRGKDDTTGIGLVEAYDLDQSVDSEFANISSRGLETGFGDGVIIGGIIVGGGNGGSTTIVVRAIGPSLGAAGVANPSQDPTLTLDNAFGTTIAFNDNWQDDPTQAAEIESEQLAPTDPHESAIIMALPPGQYTAIVLGSPGVALVEAYNVH